MAANLGHRGRIKLLITLQINTLPRALLWAEQVSVVGGITATDYKRTWMEAEQPLPPSCTSQLGLTLQH